MHNLDLLIISHHLCASYLTRNVCKEKRIQNQARLPHKLEMCRMCKVSQVKASFVVGDFSLVFVTVKFYAQDLSTWVDTIQSTCRKLESGHTMDCGQSFMVSIYTHLEVKTQRATLQPREFYFQSISLHNYYHRISATMLIANGVDICINVTCHG